MIGCAQWNPVNDLKDSRLRRGSNQEPLDKQTSAKPTELPRLLNSFMVAASVDANSFL